MKIVVKTYATLKDITGGINHSIEVGDDADLAMVLEELFKRYPRLKDEILDSNGGIKEGYRILVNGRDALHLNGLRTRVSEGTSIAIFPPVAGG